MRKYVGVPTQDEITSQFKELKDIVGNVATLEAIKEVKKNHPNIDIEINYDIMDTYDGVTPIRTIRYEYKNILVYYNIDDFGTPTADIFITVYSDDGLQFGDHQYDVYDDEIERVAQMGLLTLVE